MDYQLEQLGDEKFQELAQALILKEFPNSQAFPVGQPDGGRDALTYLYQREIVKREQPSFIMFQVKFVRNPFKADNPHDWLISVIKSEEEKLHRQIARGARQFILVTNVPGTGHLDAGSIDRANALLKEFSRKTGVPATCWWRADLNRRLDGAWDIKWAYPEIMGSMDVIRFVLETGLSEHKERRQATIRAFLQEQYALDEEVRFKQIELQNKLLELFIDVPLLPPEHGIERKHKVHLASIYEYIAREIGSELVSVPDKNALELGMVVESRDSTNSREVRYQGAATVLLHNLAHKHLLKIVLEGAPGQGKSTIAQYICQIHRMRILQKNDKLEQVPNLHKSSALKFPIKVDLRDLAAWLGRKNPFATDATGALPSNWEKTLESFLAFLIHQQSGGSEFNISDLFAIFRLSAVLLVFDGLDEIADIARRQEVVEELTKGITRLEVNTASLQVVVTSRPAAFENSPGLPADTFPYFQLGAVTRPLIDAYAKRWLRARKLQGREAAEVKRILAEKLDHPHIRDLARNPMQLAILLSLVHTRGTSLPDKRTALYDSYVDLFFSREASKSTIVRENRDLLINIHRYLAWLLQSNAETGKNASGSISEAELHRVVEQYLHTEGHSPSLAHSLFAGMVERVVAIVSRVQGTYEFEVQPLREYFAARYLFETAPYSPTGAEKRGTRPDRFDAIARNFYWLNVTRFYAGCYCKGELPSLIDRIQELIQEDGYKLISHPRVLAATLLSDWVFSQHPKSVSEVIRILLDGIGLRYILTTGYRRVARGNGLILPDQCGREELLKKCFTALGAHPPRDYALDLINVIQNNATGTEIERLWNEYFHQDKADSIEWIEYCLYLGIIGKINKGELEKLMSEHISDRLIRVLFLGKRTDLILANQEDYNRVIDWILKGGVHGMYRRDADNPLDKLTICLDLDRYAMVFRASPSGTFDHVWLEWRPGGSTQKMNMERVAEEFTETGKIDTFSKTVFKELKGMIQEWATTLKPWNSIVEQGRKLWGDRWIFFCIANLASGIKSHTETCKETSELLDHQQPLCRRARYARLRVGNSSWWNTQLAAASSQLEVKFVSMMLITWANADTIINNLPLLNSKLETLSDENWKLWHTYVTSGLELTMHQTGGRTIDLDVSRLNFALHDRTVAALGIRVSEKSKAGLYMKFLANYTGNDSKVLEFCQSVALAKLIHEPANWKTILEVVGRTYSLGSLAEHYDLQKFERRNQRSPLPTEVAKVIAREPHLYPSALVALAETMCKEVVAATIKPVAEIARQEKWFD